VLSRGPSVLKTGDNTIGRRAFMRIPANVIAQIGVS